ncbi:MAG: LysE family translocator [Candidatus Roizmanbacteria bacterium]|nr:LysE family translocator [Candidatus Roizmanbacteria bacterium]
MREFRNGLLTGLTLQLAIGPVFFFIINLSLQKTILDGFAGVLGVTLVDYLYISLAILGIGKVLKKKKVKNIFGIVSSTVLIIFGFLILKSVLETVGMSKTLIDTTSTIKGSFLSVFLITLSSPMTIVFFTSLFTAKAIEYDYKRKQLLLFGLGTGFATFLFMGTSVILFSTIKGTIPVLLIQTLNGIVGCLLVGYGGLRLWNVNKEEKS